MLIIQFNYNICHMPENKPENKQLLDSLERILVGAGGHNDYHAKLLAIAIIDFLKEEGFSIIPTDSE
jgi:hypothetical protein